MAKEKIEKEKCCEMTDHKHKIMRHGTGMGGGIYGLAFIGAAVYFIEHSDTFWMGVLGFLKAIVWPAILMYKIFTMLNI